MRSFLTLVLLFFSFKTSSQSFLSKYLSLNGQSKFDSLELRFTITRLNTDSIQYFSEIDFLKRYSSKNDDKLVNVFADYLRALYYLNGKQKSNIDLDKYLNKVKGDALKLKSSDSRDLLIANLEHCQGLYILSQNKLSAKTLNHFLKANLVYRRIGYEKVLFAGKRLNDIGEYYQLIALDFDNALKYYREAEAYIMSDPIDLNRIFFYRSLAKALAQKKHYEEAIKYNKLGMAQVRLKKDSLRIGSLMGNIGEIILNHYPNPIDAEPYFMEELRYRTKYNPAGINDIAKIYGNLGQIAAHKKDGQRSDSLFKVAFNVLMQVNDTITKKSALRSIYRNKIVSDTLLKNYESAFKYQNMYNQVLDYMYKQDLKEATTNATVQFDTQKFRMEAELANQRSKTSRFWIIIVSLALIVIMIVAYLIYLKSIINKKEFTQKLLFRKKEAERLAELDNLKTRFFTNISHELRTPLTLLVAPIEDLSKKYSSDLVFQIVKRNLNRLQNLINQLLDLSKLEAGKMTINSQSADISNFIKNILSSFESLAATNNISLVSDFKPEALIFHFDKDKIEKIITNLVSNALKFTSENGQIFVSLRHKEKSIEIKIKDNGIGMEEKSLEKIFDRYFQIDNEISHNYTGTGIGLSLVKELVSVMKGSISVVSESGVGTEFTLSIPEIINENTEQFETEQQSSGSENNSNLIKNESFYLESKEIILIVEDNADLRAYIKGIFENTFHVLEASDGKMGLELAVEHIPDLIISDLMMPKLDGLDLCKRLKSDNRVCHIPIVLLTAKADIDSKIEGFDLGADDYLAKPFLRNELVSRISNLLRNRKLVLEKYNIKSPSESNPKDLNQMFVQKLILHIEERVSDSTLNLDDLAENMNLSSIQLRRKVKAVTGINPNEFVRNYRLNKAERLLKEREDSVSEIAYSVGFESLSYFSKVFQEKFGKQPSEYS